MVTVSRMCLFLFLSITCVLLWQTVHPPSSSSSGSSLPFFIHPSLPLSPQASFEKKPNDNGLSRSCYTLFLSFCFHRTSSQSVSLFSGSFISVDPGLEDQDGQEDMSEGEERSEGVGRAVLLGPSMEQEDWSCLRLVYQLSGSGFLQVQQRREGESFDRALWSTQTASDSWLISSIDLQNSTEPYRVNNTPSGTWEAHTHC